MNFGERPRGEQNVTRLRSIELCFVKTKQRAKGAGIGDCVVKGESRKTRVNDWFPSRCWWLASLLRLLTAYENGGENVGCESVMVDRFRAYLILKLCDSGMGKCEVDAILQRRSH